MCGIAGFYDTSIKPEAADSLLCKMLSSIQHRGPDYTGDWKKPPLYLGHNRLSIIDLSDEANQPFIYNDYIIAYNGEIYNYVELGRELHAMGHRFRTKSDTEVILAAYSQWGKDCVKRFVGMWAFAIWDMKTETLFCSRDRFGIKPFYYLHEGEKFYFGSEYKALKPAPVFSNDLNLNQVSRGLQMGWVCYHDETYFSKLKALPEACNLLFSKGKVTIEKYWELKTGLGEIGGSFEEKKERFFELFKESTRIHLRSDVEIAICLSGGLDSSALTSMMAHLNPEKNYQSFSIYYDGKNEVDERPFMNAVIEKYPQIKPDYYQPPRDLVAEHLHDILYMTDIPATGSSNFSQYFMVKRIHEHNIKVVVDGQGADEYLAGYMHSFYRLFADMLGKGEVFSMLRQANLLKRNQQWSNRKMFDMLAKSMLPVLLNEQALYAFEYKHYYPSLIPNPSSLIPFNLTQVKGNHLDNFLYNLIGASSLPTILHYVDRMTMSHSLESRVPFLDHRLVEFAFQLNNEDKINETRTKYIMREAMKNLLPEKVYNRKDKKGFVTPGETNWLRSSLKHLLELNYNRLDFLDISKVKKVVGDYKNGDNKNANLVWRIATLNYWLNNLV